MMPREALTPRCECGYDLSGLEGPPWQCPECAEITLQWPPDPPLVTYESRLRTVMKWSAVAGLAFALFARLAQVWGLGVYSVCLAMLCCVAFSVAHVRWMMIGRRRWAFAESVLLIWFVFFESAALFLLVFMLIALLSFV